MLKKIFFLFIAISLYTSSFATHLVGGEMTYNYLFGTTYQVTLTIYRDSVNGVAGFDSPATVHVYDNFNNYIESHDFYLDDPFQAEQSLDNPYPNPCLDVPSNVRIQKGVYTLNITLPTNNSKYTLVYGRCCRNGALLNNLTNPGDQGMTILVEIPPTSSYSNNSPTFDNPPPIFVCLGSPMSFDQSGTDSDGDSLVYKVCTPFQGLTISTIWSIPSGGTPPIELTPPINPIVYSAPFSIVNQLGGIPLTIDINTGLLSGTPNALGSYVVGICIEEWRNGVLLSTVLRDFQYTVTNCNVPTAAIPIVGSIDILDLPFIPNVPENILGIYVKNCEDLDVGFENNSTLPGGVIATATNATYWWSFGDGTTSTQFEPQHMFPDTGTYIVEMAITMTIGTQSCSDTGYYVVFVHPIFSIDFSGDNSCLLDTSHFLDISTTAPYDFTNEWEWNFGDGSPVSNSQNPDHIYTSPGTYSVVLYARTDKGCTKLDTNTIVIHPNPLANFPNPNPICLGDTVNFVSNSTIIFGSIDSAIWDYGNGTTSNADSISVYNTSGVFPIQLTSISDQGCSNSITKNLTVNALPNIITSGDDTICKFSSIQVTSSGGLVYTWSPGALMNNANISNPIITPDSASYFYVEVIDGNNCVNNDSLYIDFLPIPIADAGMDTSVCLNAANVVVFNTSVQLQATGGVSYIWTPSTGLNFNNISNPIATPVVNTSYIVTVTDTDGCTNFDTVEVIVLNPALDLIQVSTDSLCFGDTVFVNVLDQGDITSYSWTPVTFLTDPTANEPGFFSNTNTMYTLTVQNYCYQDADSVLIEVISIPNIDAGFLDSICLGDIPYQLNANPTNFEIYQWTSTDNSISNPNIPNPTIQPITSSTYYLMIVDSVGTLACTNTDSVDILVFSNPTINIQTPLDYLGFLCQGDSVLLTSNSNDATLFNWDADVSLTSLNTSATNAFPLDTHTYYLTVENIHACTNRDSITIDVQSPIIPFIFGDSIMCVGSYVDLEATGGLYYKWYPTNANFSNQNYAITQAHLDSSMQIFVHISNDCFDDSLYKNITVHQLPIVNAGTDITILRDDVAADLNGNGDGKPLWYTSDLNFNGILNSPAQYGPTVQPLETTKYVLEIENPLTGCKNYDTMMVTVDVLTLLAFPTAFSPNNDGINDFAYILKYLNIESLDEFSIYNRYGEKIFTTNKFNAKWSGKYKGKNQEIGVYTWIIKATTKDNENILRTGNLSLIR